MGLEEGKEMIDFHSADKEFREGKLNNKKDDISSSERIAYKMFLIDCMNFEKALNNEAVFFKSNFWDGEEMLYDYFRKWMDSVNPDKLIER